MNWLLTIALVAVLQVPAAPPASVPVVVELFTSEGCSSCPPADAVLSGLAKAGTAGGVLVIPLGMHVTYWDRLGWKDPASLQAATDRQQDYGRVFGADTLYTPQAVIDGRAQTIGSDDGGLRRAIVKAAAEPHVPVTLRTAIDGHTLDAEIEVPSGPDAREPLTVRLAVTEDGLTSTVTRGENGGRTLHNDAVVRRLVGADAGTARVLRLHVDLDPAWHRDHLHAVALLQGRKSLRIYGATTTALR